MRDWYTNKNHHQSSIRYCFFCTLMISSKKSQEINVFIFIKTCYLLWLSLLFILPRKKNSKKESFIASKTVLCFSTENPSTWLFSLSLFSFESKPNTHKKEIEFYRPWHCIDGKFSSSSHFLWCDFYFKSTKKKYFSSQIIFFLFLHQQPALILHLCHQCGWTNE